MTVSSHRAEFVQYDPLANLAISNPQDVHTHPELKRKLYSALAEGDEGELSIAIPKEVPLKVSGSFHAGIATSEGNYPTLPSPERQLIDSSCYTRATNPWGINTPYPRVCTSHCSHRVQCPEPCRWTDIRPAFRSISLRMSSPLHYPILLIDHSAYPKYIQPPLLRMQHDAGFHALTASGSGVPGTSSS